MSVAFYCVADARYFPGAAGMINSLRMAGHAEPVYVLDCGLTTEQRRLLEPEAELVQAPPHVPPWLLKTIAPRAKRADIAVLIDTDMIVTRSLAPLVEQASPGGIVAFCDRQQRFFAEWGELTGATARPRPYVSSGLLVAGGEFGHEVIDGLHRHQTVVDFELTFWRRNVRGYPYLYADQDVLNAVLATASEQERIHALDQRLAATPPFRGLRILDRRRLRCAYRDGTAPFVVHQYLRKPWLEETYDGAYSRLLRRLLTDADLPIAIPPEDLPLRLRAGGLATAERARVNARDYLRWHLGDRLPKPIGTRVEAMRRRRQGLGT